MIAAMPSLPLGWFDVSAVWLMVLAALTAATVAIVALLRTRWRTAKPWKKCAILSLWVHVLLACLAAAVRLASSGPGVGPSAGPGFGPGEPIRVAILPAMTGDEGLAPNDPPAELPPPVEIEAPQQLADTAPTDAIANDEPEPAADSPKPPPLEAPDLLAQPEPIKEAEPVKPSAPEQLVAEEPTESAATDEEHHAPDSDPPQAAEPTSTVADQPVQSDAEQSAAAPPARPAAYAGRFVANRDELVAGGGGDARTEQAVRAALAWLAAAQSADGRWDAKRHGAGQERFVLNENRGGAGAKADTGVSGLALLAFLGAGHTHQNGTYVNEIARGMEFLRKSQRADGSLGGNAEPFAQMYCHSMATFAASEAYAITRDERLAPLVRGGVAYSLAAQHPSDGGWRYRPGLEGDTSQLGWQLMALKSARLAQVEIPEVTWTRAERFMRRVERGHAGGLAAYRPEGPPTRSMTAEALYCRQLLTGRADAALSSAAMNEALASLLGEPPTAEAINLYYWYYATLALHHGQHASPEALDAWRRWNEALIRTLLDTQKADGSWPETCLWGGYGGRVFTTALGAMCLEVYYRYAPPHATDGAESADVAQRRGWQSVPSR